MAKRTRCRRRDTKNQGRAERMDTRNTWYTPLSPQGGPAAHHQRVRAGDMSVSNMPAYPLTRFLAQHTKKKKKSGDTILLF